VRSHGVDVAKIAFNDDGLVPAIVQDVRTGDVLMMAWMNQESLSLSAATGETVFWSRSRSELWHKGATSGNTQQIVTIDVDCDGDTLLIKVVPMGPACHTGANTCFSTPLPGFTPLHETTQPSGSGGETST
jgi:phosphoribosyl-ATP pyrophosphohydrolase/phosphoribosyl-AMP cyclohydrolase